MESSDFEILLNEFIKLPTETEWLEFKVNNSNPEMIGQKISALSNGAALRNKTHGYLIYGVKDDTHEVVGTNFNPLTTKKGNEELEHWIIQRLSPRIDFKISVFQYDEKMISVFEIPATLSVPVRFTNNAYIRIGSITRNLNDFPEKEKKIWNKDQTFKFEQGIAMQNLNNDKVLELIDYYRYYELTNQKMPFNQSAILERLESEKFIIKSKTKYDITNFGAILFAKDLTEFDILWRKAPRIIFYKGKGRFETIQERQIDKGYAVAFDEMIDYIDDKLPQNQVIEKAFRKEVKMYPKIAIRELVANALIHQDFTIRGTSVMIEIFIDRIEITNPGAPLIETLRFIDHNPVSRNEKIASFMRRINICEERGTGIDKVIIESELYQLPAPKFHGDKEFTRVFLYAQKTLRQMDKQEKIRACYQHCSLKYVLNELMTNQTLRKRFNIAEKNYSTGSRIIKETIEAGLIKEFDPENKARRYSKYIPFWA